MAIIKPFKGIRPKPDMAGEVASLPYDVLSSDEARELVKNNPNSFLRVNKPEVDFPPETDLYGEQIYKKGRENLNRLINEGILRRDPTDCFYLYRLTMNNRSQTGLVVLTSVEEYDQGKIKKHEHTRPDKVRDRANHIQVLNAQVGPVFSIFRHNQDISELFKRLTSSPPEVDFVGNDDVRHELWVISDRSDVEALVTAFAPLPELYIADGHHRSQSASEVCRREKEKNPAHTGNELYNFFLNVIFPDNELRILPYNRVVADLNGLSLSEMLQKASVKFNVMEIGGEITPSKPHQIGLYCQHKWFIIEAKEGSFDRDNPSRSIDAAILTANLLDPVLGIADIRTDKRVDFIGGIRGTKELVRLVDEGKAEIAFSLFPVSVEQLLKVADAGQVMPPKSTWFEPKLRSGMVVNSLEE